MWYAVVGTLWNSIGIGLSLFAICQFEVFGVQDVNLQENLLFASIISAVDPVAVLNVFEDIGVQRADAHRHIWRRTVQRTPSPVALYTMFSFVTEMSAVESTDVFLGIEPLFVFMYSYLAYLVAELFAISSVLAIITCAITMKYYVEENVSQRSCTTIRHVVKMLATISETLIFFFLGILVLSQIINPFRTIQFTFKDQFGLAYGGVRGAICFALVFTLPENLNRRNLFVTASIAIILFTVFIQGISIRPIIEYMNIRRTNKDLGTINVEIHNRGNMFWFKKFNDRVLRRILLRDNKSESSIVSLYKKLELQTAIDLLDTTVGDISAAPSIVSLHDEKREAARPKKKFLAADVRKMHDLLSKNMYRIRERTMAYTNKYNISSNSRAREILIRRHASIRRSVRAESFKETRLTHNKTPLYEEEVVFCSPLSDGAL
ncbi:unnamed protein product [Lampetra planeri]